MNNPTRTMTASLLMAISLFLNPGCGAGSSVGNGMVTIQSAAYSNSRDARAIDLYATVSQFKFCITQLKIVTADGAAESSIEKVLA